MSAATERSASSRPDANAPATPSTLAPSPKPRFALFIATACGLGYLPKAPGTWGSLGGVLLYFTLYAYEYFHFPIALFPQRDELVARTEWIIVLTCGLSILIAGIGVWGSRSAAIFWSNRDPQPVVIDEVSGQLLALLIGSVLPVRWRFAETDWPGYPGAPHSVLNWKYLLLGFILFRVFDIWKPFPARQAESLPGGWGIMADDWVAGIYAGIGLWLARAAGL